jgi:hypothetical protein
MKTFKSSAHYIRLWSIVALLACLLSITGGAFAQAPAASGDPDADTAALNTLSGTLTIAGGGIPAQAMVLAWRDLLHPAANVDPATGGYSMNLWQGDWQVTVVQALPTTVSPDWVYTDGPQMVHFDGNPDPIAPAKTLDFTVSSASGTISGSLVSPNGGTDFAAPNRIWVRAQNQEGQGNTVQVDEASGAFSIHVLPGNTLLRFVFENPLWAPPLELSGAQWYVDDGATVAIDPQQLILKRATISGVVSDENGSPVAALPVHAWRLDGTLSVKGLTNADGAYSLPVIEGVWEVQVDPMAGSIYTPGQAPQRVILTTPTSSATQDLGVVRMDVTVMGSLVDGSGNPVPGLTGVAYALYPAGDRWPQFGQTAPIKNSSFILKLSSSISHQYRIKISLSDGSGYTAISGVNLSLQAGQTYPLAMPVAPNNSSISGHLIDSADLAIQTGLPAAVYGASNSGALKREKVNPLTGGYEFDVTSSDTSGQGGSYWWLKAFVDPDSGWVVQQPRLSKVFLPYNNGQGADAMANFLVAEVNAVLSGQVRAPDGQPLAGARVTVKEIGATSAVAFRRWTYTNDQGRYTLRVPAGVYKVTADFRNMISPLPVIARLSPGEYLTVNLQFRARNAQVGGTVVYAGSPHPAFIRAYSDNGAQVFTQADLNGAWTLNVSTGEAWHIQAVGEEGSIFLKSRRLRVLPAAGVDPNPYVLELLPSATLPDSLVLAFDASQNQVLTLSNGAQVIIPGGALAASGMVSVAVEPVMDLADDGGATPVSFGYRLLAFDENMAAIFHFNAPITLVVPFTQDDLSALGVTPDQLIPAYWDPSTESWKPAPNFTVQVFADGSGTVSITVDHFTDYGLLADALSYRNYIPVTAR